MDFEYSQRSLELQAQLKDFYARNIIPRWREWQASIKRDRFLRGSRVPTARIGAPRMPKRFCSTCRASSRGRGIRSGDGRDYCVDCPDCGRIA